MATKPPRVQRWFLDIGRDKIAGKRPSELPDNYLETLRIARTRERIYLSTAVKDLRRYFSGFDSADGYNLSNVQFWPTSRVETIKKYSSHLRQLQSQKFVRVTASSKSKKRALEDFTGLHYKGTKKPRAYVVHVDHPDRTKVKLDKKTKKVQIIEHFKGGQTVQQFYFFRDYGLGPFKTWDSFISGVRSLIKGTKKKPAILPPGSYTLWSEKNGTIFMPMDRDEIILNLNYRFKSYDKNFASDILGFRYFKDEITAETQIIDTMRYRREATKRKKERQKFFDKRLRGWKKPSKKK